MMQGQEVVLMGVGGVKEDNGNGQSHGSKGGHLCAQRRLIAT
jgi:hypothetical protein